MTPLFSCVMPVKGSRPYMDDALESLHSQGMGEELEIIIQDGDDEPDRGQSDALNKGFAKAHGQWLFWLNADDILLPGALRAVGEEVERKGGGGQRTLNNSLTSIVQPSTYNLQPVSWIAGNTVYIDEHGKRTDSRWNGRWHAVLNRHMPTWTFGPSAFFTRALWEKRGGFDTSLKCSMDIDLWTRWALAGERYVMLHDYLWGFRWHAGSTTAGGDNMVRQDEERQIIEQRYGFKCQSLWRFASRVAQVLDGSWFHRERF